MTNRNYIRPYSAGMAIKKPRLRRIEIALDGYPPATPEGITNGTRPHGGYRGMKQHPPGQYSFDKDDSFVSEIQDGYQVLLNQENQESHGAPYWVGDVQREITHNGESPLFTNKLLATGKFEQEHGVISMERALLSTQPRRLMSAPRRRHLNGVKEFYRPNSTHQYLSATELRHFDDSDEGMVKYGRPTRTTLLRARQRSNSAINSYDVRRQASKRMEEVKTNTIFCTAKESFDREQARISYRYFNIYQQDGETMHSFLTGARYNRAHLLDSKGLSVYGVYMPRENPADCFIATQRRMKDVGDEIPSAPPDSPRSDLDENSNLTRPTSSSRHSVTSRGTSSRPGSSRPISKTTSSRPPSHKRVTPQTLGSRPRSAKDPGCVSLSLNVRTNPPRSADSSRRELPLPDEVTMAMPDHVNKGKGGIYVTLKGQKIIESVESKLPRVTGYSLPKIRNKSRDFMEEMQVVNQPPPTPVEPSVISIAERNNRLEADDIEKRHLINDNVAGGIGAKVIEDENNVQTPAEDQGNSDGVEKDGKDTEVLGEVIVKEGLMDERKTMEIRPAKHVNFTEISKESTVVSDTRVEPDVKENVESEIKTETETVQSEGNDRTENGQEHVEKVKADNVAFFMTEDDQKEGDKEIENEKDQKAKDIDAVVADTEKGVEEKVTDNNGEIEDEKTVENGDMEEGDRTVEDVIKVEISEGDKTKDRNDIVVDNS